MPAGERADSMAEAVDLVRRSLDPSTRKIFERRVAAQAADLREQIRDGQLDNEDPTIGLELECYLVDDDGRVAALPDDTFHDVPVNRELGLHNIEVNTPAAVFDASGIKVQQETIRDRLDAARRAAHTAGARPVLDAMWTIPPPDGTDEYLTDLEETDGVVVATNMYASPRYYAIDNDVLARADGTIDLDLSGVTLSFPSILVESLTTSMQPHLQVPRAADFPRYYNSAIRTLGPVLALSTNSPFLPADLYEDVDASTLLTETVHELRIPVFEQSINAGQNPGKVRFPDDIDRPTDVVDEIVEDRTTAPFLREWIDDETDGEDNYEDTFWELGHKHGTYWRWLRAVIGGDFVGEGNDERSLRIEYRPLPTQPSVTDVIALQGLVGGLIQGLVVTDHPLAELDWDVAREAFYNAVSDGPGATLHWLTEDGARTSDADVIFDEVFRIAREGLADRGIHGEMANRLLSPIERRWEQRTSPSRWKLDRVQTAVEDGQSLESAIREMQLAYFDRMGTPFVEWD